MNELSATPNLIGLNIDTLQQTQPQTESQIEQIAQEFEGVFLSLLAKEMRKTVEEGGLFGSESSDSYGSLFDMYIGQHMAEAQPLGIASLWLEQYEKNSIPVSDQTPTSAASRTG